MLNRPDREGPSYPVLPPDAGARQGVSMIMFVFGWTWPHHFGSLLWRSLLAMLSALGTTPLRIVLDSILLGVLSLVPFAVAFITKARRASWDLGGLKTAHSLTLFTLPKDFDRED